MRAKLRQLADKTDVGLRILTYNVLAQSLIRRDYYPTSGNAIKWAQRFPAIREELVAYDPDVLFMQEVDEAKLGDWTVCLKESPLDMDYRFFKGPGKSHGLIVAYKRSRFRHIAHKQPHFDALKGIPLQISTGNTAVAMVVEDCADATRVVLCTTHLYWHPDADYERLRQLHYFLLAARTLQQNYAASHIILGGDLNSTPCSPAYEYLTTGKIGISARQALRLSAEAARFGRFNATADECSPTMLSHPNEAVETLCTALASSAPLHLASCYAALSGEPAFTNWTDGFRETIDYIAVSDGLATKAILPLPNEADLGPEPSSLPRSRNGSGYPSDHLLLVADIQQRLV